MSAGTGIVGLYLVQAVSVHFGQRQQVRSAGSMPLPGCYVRGCIPVLRCPGLGQEAGAQGKHAPHLIAQSHVSPSSLQDLQGGYAARLGCEVNCRVAFLRRSVVSWGYAGRHAWLTLPNLAWISAP